MKEAADSPSAPIWSAQGELGQVMFTPRWGPAPPLTPIGPGEVHLWRASLAPLSEDGAALLSDAERERAANIISPLRRRRWIDSRAILRRLLGRYLRAEPAAVALSADGRGRPVLESSPALRFSLSHSGPSALYAFTLEGAIGVDLQLPGRQSLLARHSLTGRLLGPGRAEQFAELPEAVRAREFLRGWVRREAELKRGGGAGWVTELELGGAAVGALALERAPQELCCWAFAPGRGAGRS